VTPEQAKQLIAEGWTYVDVRSEPEFEAGHVPGSLNVPLLTASPTGMVPNEEFVPVMQAAFGPQEKLVLGCKAGGRSARAGALLTQAGFTELVDMSAGWDGARDAFGRVVPGWGKSGLPVETGLPEGQKYADVRQRTPR
jgi:rhodanese-related sulfurtransferase